MEQIRIRRMESGDYPAIQALSLELGHACAMEKAESCVACILQTGRDVVLAAEWNGEVIGYLHAIPYALLYADPLVNIIALVVKQEFRGRGVGSALVARLEEWARENGFAGVRLGCRMERTDTHRFYERQGYESRKSQKIFLKMFE